MVFSLLVTHLNFTVRVDWPFSRSTYCWRRVETISKGEQIAQKIFVNLPVRDLRKSMNFFGKLGFTFNAQFTDETAACMTVSEDIYVMLLTETKFKTCTPKQICDATKSMEVLVCLSSASRDEVNEMGPQSGRRRGNNLQGTGRPRRHVRSWIPGSGWAHLGVGLHGAERN